MTTFESLFARYREIADPPDRFRFACQNPALISIDTLRALVSEFESDQGPEARSRMERFAELDAIRRAIAQAASRYPAGLGPVEVQATRVIDGETSLKAALEHVRRPEFLVQLAPIYVHALTWHAEQLVTGKDAATAMLWTRLLSEACLATCPGKSMNERLEIAATGFIQIAGAGLGSFPDGEMLQAAEALGRNVLERLVSSESDPRRGALLHALGVLYSDPVSGPSGWGVDEINQRQQLRKLEAVKGPALARQHLDTYPLPSAKDALQTAIDYYERALPDRAGEQQGITLKAMVQTLEFLARARNEEPDRARMTKLCAEALPLLPAGEYQHRALVALMARLGLEGAPAPAADFNPDSPEAALQLQAALKATDPARALSVLVDAAALFRDSATEALRRKRLLAMMQLIPLAHGGALNSPIEGSFKETVDRVMKTADAEHWPIDRACAALVWLAMRSETTDDEETGLRLLKTAIQKSPSIAAYQEPLSFLYAHLCIGIAKNAVKAGDASAAVQAYAQALAPTLRLGMPSAVFDLLAAIADMAGKPGEDMLFAALAALAPVAFEIDRELGASGDEALQAVYRNAFANLGDSINSATVAMLLQLAKGARFSALLRQGPAFDWREDEAAAQMSNAIVQLQNAVGLDEDLEPMDEVLLVSASSAGEPQSGDTEASRLANLQRALDRRLTQLLIEGVRSSAILDPEAIGQLLGPDTVLLDYYYAPHDAKQYAVYILAYTREEILCFKNLVPGDHQEYLVGKEGSQAVVDDIGMQTYRLRHSLPLDPLDPAVQLLHADAREALASDFNILLGMPTWTHLETLRKAGKTHLCIRPYGALRYYPLHILGPGDEDLAQHWTVTTIPSLECLMQPAPETREGAVQALGLSYKDGEPFPLVELPGAHHEVQAIAAATKTDPLLDAEVTEARIFIALTSNRWVHLCAHGANNASSPLFQHLFVTPDAESDGRICAYEIFGHDLRGLELLSLGSCDSALGRFDAGDNLSGLPAALLAAGVSSIVASLWELSDDAAATFFPRLYGELAQGATRLEAFRRAQLAVRAAYPQPRDWAAFCYIGAWSHPGAAVLDGKSPYINLG